MNAMAEPKTEIVTGAQILAWVPGLSRRKLREMVRAGAIRPVPVLEALAEGKRRKHLRFYKGQVAAVLLPQGATGEQQRKET
jgi:hypothetical protein